MKTLCMKKSFFDKQEKGFVKDINMEEVISNECEMSEYDPYSTSLTPLGMKLFIRSCYTNKVLCNTRAGAYVQTERMASDVFKDMDLVVNTCAQILSSKLFNGGIEVREVFMNSYFQLQGIDFNDSPKVVVQIVISDDALPKLTESLISDMFEFKDLKEVLDKNEDKLVESILVCVKEESKNAGI